MSGWSFITVTCIWANTACKTISNIWWRHAKNKISRFINCSKRTHASLRRPLLLAVVSNTNAWTLFTKFQSNNKFYTTEDIFSPVPEVRAGTPKSFSTFEADTITGSLSIFSLLNISGNSLESQCTIK